MIYKLKIVGLPITSICNLNCAHCLRIMIKRYKQFIWNMSIDQAKHIAFKLQGNTDYINVSAGYGETFLNPDVSSILKTFKDQGLKTIAYTNATPITINNIIESEVYLLLISIDSFHFSNNKVEIEHLLHVFQNEKRFAHELHLNIVLQPRENEMELINYVKKLCDRYPDIVAEFHWRNQYFSVDKLSTNTMATLYKTQIPSNRQIIPPTFSYYIQNKCTSIFDSLYFDELGNVRTCCIFMNSNHKLNIYKHSVHEIFNSEYMEAKRDDFASNNGFKQCKNCPIGHGFLW